MIINHNMQALNAHRQMGTNATNAQKSMEKLSSGLRINRAGDDAAGLAISEKMRGQIRGLDQASRNAQDGISMIQTAEGALNETHSILQRMRELSVQSSNDTNTDADRAELQKEIEQLTQEIDRIGNTTEFNTKSLLKGDGATALEKTGVMEGTATEGTTTHTNATQQLTATALADGTLKVTINGEELTINVKTDANITTNNSAVVDKAGIKDNTINVTFKGSVSANDSATAIRSALEELVLKNDKLKGNVTIGGATDKIKIDLKGDLEGSKGNITGTTAGAGISLGTASVGSTVKTAGKNEVTFKTSMTDDDLKALLGKGFQVEGNTIEFYNSKDGAYKGSAIGIDISSALEATATKENTLAKTIAEQLSKQLNNVNVSATGAKLTFESKETGKGTKVDLKDGATKNDFEVSFQVGANEGQNMSVKIGDMRAEALGVSTIDVSKKEGAESAITVVDKAMATVSSQRSNLGAVQNRLEHTINNLGTSSENLTAAESRIRDVDMAKEMMTMSKNNILNQAAQAMLAQANQAPQQVLQLLR